MAILLIVALPAAAQVVPIPKSADVSRVKPEERQFLPEQSSAPTLIIPGGMTMTQPPAGAETIHLVLRAVNIEGATIFSPEQLRVVYAPYLGHDITLNQVYQIADAITKRYRDAGYFLSLASVPMQHIKDGIITLQVIEGYIGQVDLPPHIAGHAVVRGYLDQLIARRPLTSDQLESFLLRLNDLPGLSFRSVLTAMPGASPGVIKLILTPMPKRGQGVVTFDNYSSRFFGPNEITAEYSMSILPLQQTTLSALTSLPTQKLSYATLEQTIPIAPELTLDLGGNFTKAHPGYTLKPEDVRSKSPYFSAALLWQAIRQRQENLSFKLDVDSRNSSTDILDTLLSNDHVRAARLSVNYDRIDNWQGSNTVSLTLSQGLDIFNASHKDDLDLSRAGATPTFEKAELSVSRLQGITPNWSLLLSANGQLSANRLFSAEQFGYGGQAFGRAFDSSTLTGDQGIDSAVELRYDGWREVGLISAQPYTFYDIGTVRNKGFDPDSRQSGSSAGLGLRAATRFGLSGNIGLAFPLTRKISDPIYGSGHAGPRLLLQISQGF